MEHSTHQVLSGEPRTGKSTASNVNRWITHRLRLPWPAVPGPEAAPFVGHLRQRIRDPIAFFTDLQKSYGDVVRWFAGPVPVVMLFAPVHARAFLLTPPQKMIRGLGFEVLKVVLGEGLFTSNGSNWKGQRRVTQQTLSLKELESIGTRQKRIAQAWARQLPFDPSRQASFSVNDACAEIALRMLFEGYLQLPPLPVDELLNFHRAVEVTKKNADRRLHALLLRSAFIPSVSNLRLHRARKQIHQMAARAMEVAPSGSPLQCFHAAHEAQSWGFQNREDLRDHMVTMLITGYETVASTLTFAMQHLALDPRLFTKLHQPEWRQAIVKEALRMYPAAWLMTKQCTENVVIGTHTHAPGQVVMTSPFLIQRDERFYHRPDEFLPERWIADPPAQTQRPGLNPDAYFPFGNGARSCIGAAFAEHGLIAALEALADNRGADQLKLLTPPCAPMMSITLRPGHEVAGAFVRK